MNFCQPCRERRGLLSLLTGAVVAALLFGTQAVAQTNQPSMDVGTVTLSLGMPRDKVLAQIKQAGYKVLELAPEGKATRVAVARRDKPESLPAFLDNEGELFFRGGTLVRIFREVATSNINTDRDLAFALYAIVQGLEKEGSSHLCSVSTTEGTPVTDEPGIEAKTILLTCSVGRGAFRTSHVRWVTSEKLRDQFHVRVFQELWR
jgi:hypothetical protein